MAQQLGFALQGALSVLLIGLVLGAGLPAVFAAGVRSLAWGTGADTGSTPSGGTAAAGKVVAVLLFAVVGYAVISGILFVIASGQGMMLDFSHVIPTFVPKG